jgi:insulysin
MIEFYKHFIHPSSPARSKLAIHMKAQSPPSSDTSTVMEVVGKVMEVVGEVVGKVMEVVGKGLKVLGLNKDPKGEEDGEVASVASVDVEGNGTTPYIITDVREFRSMLQVSAGPQPVKHISEFEDLDSEL